MILYSKIKQLYNSCLFLSLRVDIVRRRLKDAAAGELVVEVLV